MGNFYLVQMQRMGFKSTEMCSGLNAAILMTIRGNSFFRVKLSWYVLLVALAKLSYHHVIFLVHSII